MCREMEKMRNDAHEEGRAEEKKATAIRMFDKGYPVEDISSLVEQTVENIKTWLVEVGRLPKITA